MLGIKSKHIIRELNFEFGLILLFIQEQIRLTQEILEIHLDNKEILRLINIEKNENSNQKTTLSVLDSIKEIEGEFELF